VNLTSESYHTQAERWPKSGRCILAQYDDLSVIVYQAYRPSIGRFAAENGSFGGEFSFTRMSWIKTNFLWMMFRSGWGTKPDQEITLAIRLQRAAFEGILAQAVHSTFQPECYASAEAYEAASRSTQVRLQWDPDHHPSGAKLDRRAIQLGLRGDVLLKFAREWIIDIEDISAFVAEQRVHVQAHEYDRLITPREMVYPVSDHALAHRLGLSDLVNHGVSAG